MEETKQPDLEPSVEMLNIPVDLIDRGNRFRSQLEDIGVLAEEIKQKGLIQPIAVQRISGQDQPYLLVAGGRRHAAAVLAELTTIPCRVYPETLDELDRREIELMENISRKDLGWKDHVRLTNEIHRLWTDRYGDAATTENGHSADDTAKLLGTSSMTVSRHRELAEGLEHYEDDLSEASTARQAHNILRQKYREAEDAKVASDYESEADHEERRDKRRQTLINAYKVADFFEAVKEVPGKSASLAEVDPPYGVNLVQTKRNLVVQSGNSGYNEVDGDDYPDFLDRVITELDRVLLPDGWLILWHSSRWYPLVVELLEAHNYKVWKVPAIWYKPPPSPVQATQPYYGLASGFEPFVYARKPDAVLYRSGHTNVFPFRSVAPQLKVHPTERPVELIQEILAQFVRPGSNIIVPFAGSGNTLLAGANLGCNTYGYDLTEEYKNAYVRRVLEGTPGQYHSYPETPSATSSGGVVG